MFETTVAGFWGKVNKADEGEIRIATANSKSKFFVFFGLHSVRSRFGKATAYYAWCQNQRWSAAGEVRAVFARPDQTMGQNWCCFPPEAAAILSHGLAHGAQTNWNVFGKTTQSGCQTLQKKFCRIRDKADTVVLDPILILFFLYGILVL